MTACQHGRWLRTRAASLTGVNHDGLLYEIRGDGMDGWRELATLTASAQPGSISNNAGGRRDVVMFRCCGPYSLIEQSLGGADIEIGSDRGICAEGFELLATLHPGESYEMAVTSDSGLSYTARWTHRGC